MKLLISPPRLFLLPRSLSLRSLTARRRTMATTTAACITLPRTPLFEALARQPQDKSAIIHSASGKTFSYGSLLADVAAVRGRLLGAAGTEDLNEQRVALLIENGYEYVVNLLGIFASGGIAVPLCTGHPAKEMRYVLGDSTPTQLLASAKFTARAEEILDGDVGRLVRVEELPPGTAAVDVSLVDNDWVQTNRGALIIYTSGTTNLPKGVVSTHASLAAQAGSLITAWDMSPADHLLHVLPLHHVHGVVNGTLAPLMSGGTVEYLFPFTAPNVWTRLVSQTHDPITLFMAVPTIYSRLITTLPTLSSPIQSLAPTAVRRLRLAISGSAALPSSIRSAWRSIAGSPIGGGTMLERYGMSEIGMALSNRLDERVDNAVGWPLPGVEARLVNEDGSLITAPHTPGEIQIRGATVFREYWGKPAATAAEFTPDRWFRTGDVAAVDEDGCYFIHGRRSVDIIKSGGEKVSALEVERELLELEQVAEAAVVGVEDEDWGQRVAAVVVLSEAAKTEGWKLEDMRKVMKGRVAAHKVPSVMKVVDVIERNQMGKINKKVLVKKIFGDRT